MKRWSKTDNDYLCAMARIKLDIPDILPYQTEIRVRITDLNYGNHLGNDRLLAYLQEARVQWLADLGLSELDAHGVGFLQVDSAIQYLAEGFFNDRIRIEAGTAAWTPKSWDFVYRLTLADQDNRLLALAKTGMVAFDYSTRKVVRVPDPLHKALGH
ncbi:MAG: thioesterase family protein [Saprospiraceae bacterium]